MSSEARKIFLDTSFLNRLAQRTDPDHENAKNYYRRFRDGGSKFLISTIVVAEYGVGAPITSLPLRDAQLIPFNFSHAQLTAEFAKAAFEARRQGVLKLEKRVVIPNDTKLLAQAESEKVDLFIGRDDNCEAVWRFLKVQGFINFDYLDLRTPPSEHFGELFDDI